MDEGRNPDSRRGRRGRGRRRPRRERRARGSSALPMITLVAPIAAQALMVIMLLLERRWLFAAMVAPGMVGCMASAASSLADRRGSSRRDESGTTSHDAAGGRPSRPTDMAGARGRHHGSADGADRDKDEGESEDPSRIHSPSLEELTGLQAEPLPWRIIARTWLASPSLCVTVGMGSGQRPFTIDLPRQGPHALVAGTTGSGKSVLLQSWCLAMAVRNPPDRLHFVFLDFKGGSAFSVIERLPHTVGSVCDLDLNHAVRALRALELELRRREHLVAAERVGSIGQLQSPPPSLIVVIDEFHALNNQLPDYVDRLVRIASLGRSLGMHVIACTQNPLGQVSADMKANMALNICLRVRDGLQSIELLGDGRAASISPSAPGCAWRNDGESVEPFRCAFVSDIGAMVEAARTAAAFHGLVHASALFTAPLPRIVEADMLPARSSDVPSVPFALADDGIGIDVAELAVNAGNVGIIGSAGRGKSTILALLAHRSRDILGLCVRWTRREGRAFVTSTVRHHRRVRFSSESPPPVSPHLLWLVDDADTLFDPFGTDPLCARLKDALGDHDVTVVFAVETSKHIRIPEHCGTRIVFPTGERTVDLMDGIPAGLLSQRGPDDIMTAGRAVLLREGNALWIQCAMAKI
ncbi:MAG: cell division protein FtsK [Bifidobacterium bifidum]|nr:cell division protein FtsK [Bifidobacterium bifidum]